MTIEEIKTRGAVRALHERIENIKHRLSYDLWNGTVNKDCYTNLGPSIHEGIDLLREMSDILAELQALEPNKEHK